MKKYTITLTEEQMSLIADAVEDWHRFLGGDCTLWHATQIADVDSKHILRQQLNKLAHPYVTPDLPMDSNYDYTGMHCPKDSQRKAIAMSYGIYRQILHTLAVENGLNNVYSSPTLTCPEQGGLIQIKAIEEQ